MEHTIPSWMLAPFALQLLAIAAIPLTGLARWWESNTHKLAVSLLLGAPVAAWMCAHGMSGDMAEQMLYDYVPFILLLTALFVTTGGICIQGDLRATPATNTLILAAGFLLASLVGTTGAAMLLIRLLIQTNSQRKYTTHTVLFFIALVANCGGILSPLGDPPLFLLFQQGAPFGWFLGMAPEWAAAGGMLLAIYFALDTYNYRRETHERLMEDERQARPVTVGGLVNIVWLLCVVASTMFINDKYLPAIGAEDAPFYLRLLREWAFILIILLSLATTRRSTRRRNEFSWAPIAEVAAVFCGIFATMAPALMFLRAHPVPVSEPWQFVYATGALSAFLDNAPTAMVFHATAHSLSASCATLVAGVGEPFLRAICMGAVFFGSLTYIGNGPNFMVKSIAERSGVRMPSFFGYMLKFSLVVCLPVYVVVQLIFL